MIEQSSEKSSPSRLSVIMSVFNGANYLRESIASIQNQSFEDWEFLIMDDGSTDDTPNILKEISDSRIHCFTQKNAGLTVSLNRLAAKAKGEFIARQDADDISFECRFETQVRYLDSHPEIGLLGSWAIQIDETGSHLDEIRPVSVDEDIREKLPVENPFVHATIVVRTDQFKTVGGYRAEFKYSQDYDFVLRVSEKSKLANVETMLCAKRHNPNMVSVTNNEEQSYYAELARKMWRERKEKGVDLIDSKQFVKELFDTGRNDRAGQINYHQRLISAWLRKGECEKTRKEIRLLARLSPFDPMIYVKYMLTYMGRTFVMRSASLWDGSRSSKGSK